MIYANNPSNPNNPKKVLYELYRNLWLGEQQKTYECETDYKNSHKKRLQKHQQKALMKKLLNPNYSRFLLSQYAVLQDKYRSFPFTFRAFRPSLLVYSSLTLHFGGYSLISSFFAFPQIALSTYWPLVCSFLSHLLFVFYEPYLTKQG